MPRTRKAWSVKFKGYPATTYYAPSASAARAQAIDAVRDAWGCTWDEALSEVARAARAPESDIALPDRHPLAPQLDPKILHCVVHAYGGKGLKAGYRDHFYTCATDWRMSAALYHGLFEVYRRDKGRNGGTDSIMYALTDLGRNVAAGEVETYPRF